jgi:DNA-binding phage protein
LSGNAASARLILRDLVNATLGFGELAEQTHKPVKSVHRMLSDRGNPSMDNIASILEAVQSTLSSDVVIQVVKAHKRPSRSNPKRTKAALSLSDPRPS